MRYFDSEECYFALILSFIFNMLQLNQMKTSNIIKKFQEEKKKKRKKKKIHSQIQEVAMVTTRKMELNRGLLFLFYLKFFAIERYKKTMMQQINTFFADTHIYKKGEYCACVLNYSQHFFKFKDQAEIFNLSRYKKIKKAYCHQRL